MNTGMRLQVGGTPKQYCTDDKTYLDSSEMLGDGSVCVAVLAHVLPLRVQYTSLIQSSIMWEK